MNAKEFRDNWCNHNFPIAHNQMYIIENGEQKIEELSRYAMKLLTYKVLKEELTNLYVHKYHRCTKRRV